MRSVRRAWTRTSRRSNSPAYHDEEALVEYKQKTVFPDPTQHQLRVFLSDVKTQLSNANVRSFLRLYTTLGTDKLASFLEIDEEELVEMMMVMKNSTRSLKWSSGSLLHGQVVNTSDLDFVIDTDMVHIAESRVGRRYGDWFLRNGTRMHDVLNNIQAKPLPIVSKQVQDEAAAAAAEAKDAKDKKVKNAWAAGVKAGPPAFSQRSGGAGRSSVNKSAPAPAGAWGSSKPQPSVTA